MHIGAIGQILNPSELPLHPFTTQSTYSMSNFHLSEQEIIRRQKLEELSNSGIDAYPAALYPVNNHAATIKKQFKGEENKEHLQDVCLAGRVMSIRDMGKASFAVLQDSAGRIQLYVKRDEICPGEDKSLYDKVWKHLSIWATSLG